PCGIGARQRLPRFERPRSRAILVEAPVSSMKTSLSGSRLGTSSRQAWRAAATSGLSCSAACAVFFEGHGVTIEETPNRARRKRHPQLGFEHLSNLDQGHIRVCTENLIRVDDVMESPKLA